MRIQLLLLALLLSWAITVLSIPAPTTTSTIPDISQIQRRDDDCKPTIAPDANGYVPPSECNALYSYYPSFGAAVALSTLFGILIITHFVQAVFHKTGFTWVIIMSAIWECVGFVTRTLSTRHQQNEAYATVSQILILLAPLWVNAFDYMVLARMIHFFMPESRISIIKPAHLTTIFVLLDIGSFIVQAVGGLMAGPGVDPTTMKTGIHIYMIGMGVQEFFILCFLLIAIVFHNRILHLEKQGALEVGEGKTQWRGLLYALYTSLAFITIRIIYRLVEFSSGTDISNPLVSHEWFMYVFDAVPMLFAIGVWNGWHPGAVLKGPDAKMPPSPLTKFFRCCCCSCCCCFRRKDKKKARDMQKLVNAEHFGRHEMAPLQPLSGQPSDTNEFRRDRFHSRGSV